MYCVTLRSFKANDFTATFSRIIPCITASGKHRRHTHTVGHNFCRALKNRVHEFWLVIKLRFFRLLEKFKKTKTQFDHIGVFFK